VIELYFDKIYGTNCKFRFTSSNRRIFTCRKSMEITFLLRQQKVNIPQQVKEFFVCKEKVPCSEVNGTLLDSLEGLTCLYENCVLIDSSCTILGVLVHNFCNGEIAKSLFDKVNAIYRTRGAVKKGDTKKGRRMVVCGYKWDNFIEGIHRY
jgi:hypothetical protein